MRVLWCAYCGVHTVMCVLWCAYCCVRTVVCREGAYCDIVKNKYVKDLTYMLLLLLFTAIELSLGGSSPYTSTDKTNKNKYT